MIPFDAEATAPEQCELIAALVRCHKPATVVEAGTYKAHGAVYIAQALNQNGHGVLHTADPHDFGQAATLQPYTRAHFWHTDFEVMLDKFKTVDFAYIDASRFGKDGTRDASIRSVHFEAVLEKITPGGIICVDDTAADDWNDGENGRSVLRIREKCLNFRFLRGISVYQAP